MEEHIAIKSGLEGILKKSSEIMSKKGFHGTSMRDLAKATNMSLSGLYHYFDSKQELIYIINHRGFTTLNNHALEAAKSDRPIEDRLKAFIRSHVDYFCQNRSEMRVMLFGMHGADEIKSTKIRDLKEKYRLVGRELVSEYIEKSSGKAPTRKELDRKTFLLFGMMNWIFGWYSSREHGSEEELTEDIFLTFTEGVRGNGNGTSKHRR